MANRYWVGGTDTWNGTAGTKWATTSGGAGGASVPSNADDVFFDANSGTGTITIAAGQFCQNLNCTGFTGFIAGTNGIGISGSLTLVAGMGSWLSAGIVTMDGGAGGTINITTGGKLITSLLLNGAVTFSLQDALSAGQFELRQGTFNTNNNNISCTAAFQANVGSLTRTINLGSSTITISGNSFSLPTTNMTFNAGTSHIQFTGNGSKSLSNGSTSKAYTYYDVTFPSNLTLGSVTLQGQFTFHNLTLDDANTDLIFSIGGSSLVTTVTGTLTLKGFSSTARLHVRSAINGQEVRIDAAAIATEYVNFNCVKALGAAIPWTGTSIGVVGCTDITGDSSRTLYWVGDTGWWQHPSHWSLTSGGAAATTIPLPQDDCVFDGNSFSATGHTVTLNNTSPLTSLHGRSVTWTGVTNNPQFNMSVALWMSGSLTLASGMTIGTGNGGIRFLGPDNANCNTAGKSIPGSVFCDKQAGTATGTLTLQANLSLSGTSSIVFTGGTLNANGFNTTAPNGYSAQVNYSEATPAFTMGSGTHTSGFAISFNLSAFTLSAGTSTLVMDLSSATTRTMALGGKTYNKIQLSGSVAGTVLINQNNTISELEVLAPTTGAVRTLQFQNSSTQNIGDFKAVGTSGGNTISLRPANLGAANKITFNVTSVDRIHDYLVIQDNGGSSPGGRIIAGPNSTDNTGNTGWAFDHDRATLTQLVIAPTRVQTGEVLSSERTATVNQQVPAPAQLAEGINLVPRNAAAAQSVPAPAPAEAAQIEVRVTGNKVYSAPARNQAAAAEVRATQAHTPFTPLKSQAGGVEVHASQAKTVPAPAMVSLGFTEGGADAIQLVPYPQLDQAGFVDVAAELDHVVPQPTNAVDNDIPVDAEAYQVLPAPSTHGTGVVNWTPLAPNGFGGRLMYQSATGFERSMADTDVERIIGIEAELIIKNWDPYQVQLRNIPFLAYGLGVTLWEADYWNESTKRDWLANQWGYKQLRGTVAGIRAALAPSRYELKDYINPPQGFYVSPDLPPEEFNSWIRLMPELRLTYAEKRGVAFDREWFLDDAFVGFNYQGLRDGYALRGRYGFLRHNGIEQPLHLIEYKPAREEREGINFERVSTPGLSTVGFFVGDAAVAEDLFAGFAETDPEIYTLRLDQAFSVDVTQVQLTILTPDLEPLTPNFEVNSDIGDGNSWFFVNDFVADFRFADWEDGGARLLAQRMYLLDPAVAAPMTFGSSFVGVDRVGLPVYSAELLIDLKTKEDLPSIFAADMFVGTNYANAEDPSHIDRALRAVVDAKALRDTMMVSFAPKRLVQMGDYLKVTTVATDYLNNTL